MAKAFELKLELHQELFDVYTQLIPNEPEVKRLAIVPNPCEIINIVSTSTRFFKILISFYIYFNIWF